MLDPNTGNYTSLADTGYTRQQIVEWFNALSAKTGASVEPGDVDALIAKLMGGSGYIPELGGDPAKAFAEFEAQYVRRGGGGGAAVNVGTTSGSLANIPTAGVNVPTPSSQYQTSAASGVAGGPGALTGETYTKAGLMTPAAAGGGYPFPMMGLPTSGGFLGLSMTTWLLIGGAAAAAWWLYQR